MSAVNPAKKRSSSKPAAKIIVQPAANFTTKSAKNSAAEPARQSVAKPAKHLKQQVTAAEAKRKASAQANTTLLRSAAEAELLKFRKDAEVQRVTVQQANQHKAAKSYAQAAEKQKMEAVKAEQELDHKKIDVLRNLLIQKLEYDALDAGTKGAKRQKSNNGDPGSKAKDIFATYDPTLCKCGDHKVFCKDPVCIRLYCEQCSFSDETEQSFESCAGGSAHQCKVGQAPGPYCKVHFKKYLARCRDCGTVECHIPRCEGCSRKCCEDCLKDEMCERCSNEWQATRAEYGIESDDSYSDPFGY